MANAKQLKKLQNLIWILIYAGLLTLVLGLFTERSDDALGWSMVIIGGLLAVVGVVLIFVRARLRLTDT